MRIFCFSIFLFGIISCANSAISSENKEKIVKFEPVNKISIKDLWSFTSPKLISSSGDAVIGFYPFDYDEIEQNNQWSLTGIIVGGLSDVGIKPIAAKVWIKPGVELLLEHSIKESRLSDSAVAIFNLPDDWCIRQRNITCQDLRTTFLVTPDGNVFAAGVKIGEVQLQ